MEKINQISQKLRDGGYTSNPVEAAQDRAVLAGEFAWIMGQLEQILQTKPAIWNELRKNVKSDTACERVWEQTEAGINEMGLKLRAKSVEKMMQALGTLVKIAESEANNLM